MSEKQKAVLEGLLRLEFAMNSMLRDAIEEHLPVDLSVFNNKVHVAVDQRQLEQYMTMTVVPNDE